MKERVVSFSSLIFLTLVLAITPLSSFAAEKTIKLKCIAAWPLHVAQDVQYHNFIAEANKRAKESGVALTLEKTGGPEVVGTRDQFKALRSGIVDMVYTAGAYFLGETLELSALGCIKPEPERQLEALRRTNVLDVIAAASRKKSQTIPLGYIAPGSPGTTLLSTRLINGADWSGLKVRSFSKQTAMGISSLGGSPITIASSEVFEGLQRGVFDAVIGSPYDRLGFGERGVYKYILSPRFLGGSAYMFISARTWDRLPADAKSLLKAVAQDLEEKSAATGNELDEKSVQEYIKEGVKVVKLSPEDERKAAKAFRFDYLETVRKASPEFGQRLFDLLKDYVY